MAKSNLAVVEQAVGARGQSFLTRANTIKFGWASLEEAFPPDVDPGRKPLGAHVLCQVRHPKTRTAGGIWLTSDDRATEYYNTQIAKVIELGPLCFKAVDNSEPLNPKLVDWPEGPWFEPGDYVWLPKYGGDRFEVKFKAKDEKGGEFEDTAIFATFKAVNVIHRITADPLSLPAFLD